MAGRPKLPAEVKKLKGTYRSDRHDEQVKQEHAMAAVLPKKHLKTPEEITDPETLSDYKEAVRMLRSLGGIYEQKADSPVLAAGYLALQKSRALWQQLNDLDILDPEYDKVSNLWFRYSDKFERVAKEFYLTPKSRTQLKIDTLTATEKAMNIVKQESAIGSLLKDKQS